MPLRPLRAGETIDAAIGLYRAHWKTFMAIVAFVMVPFVFLQQLATTLLVGGEFLGLTAPAVSNERAAWFVGLGITFAALDFLLIRPFLTAAMVRAVASAYLGEIPSVGPTYRFAIRRLGSILWVLLLAVLAVVAVFAAALGFSALFVAIEAVPLVIAVMLAAGVLAATLYVRWQFGPSVVIVEGERGTAALRRSWRLSSHAFWKIVGTTILGSILAGVVGGLFAIVPMLLSIPLGSAGWLVRAGGSALSSVITTPFVTMITVLLYFDQRIRKEGLDLSIMSSELQATSKS